LGRPLSRTGDDVVEPDPAALPPLAALVEAQRLIDSGHSFAAHEVLEAVWKETTGPQRALWRGLAQLAVALTHQARGNDAGARALLLRGAETLDDVEGEPLGVAVRELRLWASTAAEALAAAPPMPPLRSQAADERA
jgi:predicted metal-dependent hydrolase